MNCNVEYEEDRKFCKYCGNPLVPKLEPVSPQEKVNSMGEEPSHKKLTCPDCKIVYDFGSSCIQCGAALVTEIPPGKKEKQKTDHIKPPATLFYQTLARTVQEPETIPGPKVEEKPIPLQTIQEQLLGETSDKLICPTCKIIYEHGDSCVRCGKTLVAQLPLRQQEAPECPETPEVRLEGLLLQNLEEHNLAKVEQAPNKGIEVPLPSEVGKKEETSQPEIPEQQPKISTGDWKQRLSFPKKRKVDYRRLLLEAGSLTIMVLAGGYFLWSIFTHQIIKEPVAKTQSPKEVFSPALPNPPIPANATATVSIPQETTPAPVSESSPSDAVPSETSEIKKIKELLENIRQANLKKDVDLFLSCYTSDFKDREVKKKTTLDNWKRFDYLDLTYDLKNPSITGDTARAKVEWVFKISPKSGGQSHGSKTILDVILKKEEGGWKIREVK